MGGMIEGNATVGLVCRVPYIYNISYRRSIDRPVGSEKATDPTPIINKQYIINETGDDVRAGGEVALEPLRPHQDLAAQG